MRFQEFKATAKCVECLQTYFNDDGFYDVGQPGLVYAGETVVEINNDGTYTLIIHNVSRISRNLEELQAHLYAWVVTEFGEDWKLSHKTIRFMSTMYAYNPDAYVKAFLANELSSPICHMHDFCDANQFAIDAAGTDDINDAFEVYDAAVPYINAN